MTTAAPVLVTEEPARPTKSCTNCGDALVDVYCARCGEKQPNPHDLRLGHFVHEVFHELVHLDSKVFRTLRDLVVKPGHLTVEYFAGRKKRYIAPLRLFLTLFALTFIAYSVYKPVAIYSLDGLMRLDPKQNLKQALERAAGKRSVPYEQVVARVETRWQKNMSLVSMVSILSVAVLLKLLYVRHRRFFTEHLVFGTHYMCFVYMLSLFLWPVYLVMGLRQSVQHAALTLTTAVLSCVYIYFALRRVYGQSGPKTLAKSVVVWAGTFLTSMVLMAGSLLAAIIFVLRA